jgi:hypothetical protein
VDQNLNNSPNDFLWPLLENPANDANSHVYNLHRLVDDFPQSGILQALLAHASEEKNLKRASAYFNPRALFKLINAPATLTGVPDERIVIQPGISVNGSYNQSAPSVYEESNDAFASEDLVVDKGAPPLEAVEEQGSHHTGEELIIDHNAEEYLSHVTGEEHGVQPVTGEAGSPAAAPQTEEGVVAVHEPPDLHIAAPVEEETATDHEAAPAHLEHAAEDEVLAAHETGATTELLAEEIAGEEVTQSGHSETAAADHLPEHQAVHAEAHESREEELHKPEAIRTEGEEHGETTDEISHAPDEALHIEHKSAFEVASAEVTEQTIGFDADKEEPVQVIDLADEKPAEILTEIPVEEDIKPQTEIPLREESISQPEIPVHTDIVAAPEAVDDEADEIYDEIVGIEDINLGDQNKHQFFSFDQEFGAHEDREVVEHTPAPAASAGGEPEQQDVSRYHDEKMPYTFMWWLDKTRKEHAQIYQPYVKPPAAPKRAKKITDELQQQYFENIFHITSVEELDKSTSPAPASPDLKRKDQLIIERFIKEEPQIKPQSSDKLDNENKAKKSSEDRDELVSETLAAIYTDQMLYHKAIASYKKLMLKFPEKSRYFAEKIEQLEKKTN